jgi:hypothetical protein
MDSQQRCRAFRAVAARKSPMQKSVLLFLAFGCSYPVSESQGRLWQSLAQDAGVPDSGSPDVLALGDPLYFDDAGSLPEIQYFAVKGDDPYGYLQSTLEESLTRWQAALCTPLRMGPGQHTLEYGDSMNMIAGRLGQTSGTWQQARMKVKDLIVETLQYVTPHEVGHVLARSNTHTLNGLMRASINFVPITTEDVTYVCSHNPGVCRCQNPEAP